MKKTAVILLAALMTILFCSCNSGSVQTKSAESIATSTATTKTVATTKRVTTNIPVTTTEPVPVEQGFENLESMGENENGEVVLVRIGGYSGREGMVESAQHLLEDDDELDFNSGWVFRDGIIESVWYIKSETEFVRNEVYTYTIYDNSNLHILGKYGSNTDFIIVERIELSEKATVLKCRVCGNEDWFISAASLDWSTMRRGKFSYDDTNDSVLVDFLK